MRKIDKEEEKGGIDIFVVKNAFYLPNEESFSRMKSSSSDIILLSSNSIIGFRRWQ